MPTYIASKAEVLGRAGGPEESVLRGVQLEGALTDRWFGIRPCICVTEPCPCDDWDDIIVWLPKTTAARRPKRRTGIDSMREFEVDGEDHHLV